MDISKINPWVDPAPSNERDMRLNQIRQQIKKKNLGLIDILQQDTEQEDVV